MTTNISRVPFVDLAAQQAEVATEIIPAVTRILKQGNFIGGTDVSEFESEYADYLSVAECVGVGNGTDALELAMLAAGIGSGDEVIVPTNTFIATVEAVVRVGATPVLVDVDETNLLITAEGVSGALTEKTAAVIAVHLFGQVAPVEEIADVIKDLDILLIEDAAQSQGAKRFGRPAGSLGHIAATSFYPGKNLGAAGDAGAVMTSDQRLADRVRLLGAHGSQHKYVHELMGRNSRLDTIQAVVLRAKLRRLDRWNELRREAAARYAQLLADIPGVTLPCTSEGNVDVWHLYVIQVEDRERIAESLSAAGISTGIHYPTPIHLTEAWNALGLPVGSFPIAEASATRILSLPMYPHITEAEQQHVASTLRAAMSLLAEAK